MSRFTHGDLTTETSVPSERVQLLAEGWEEVTADELETRTVAELKEELAAAGKSTSGKKADLVQRLAEPTAPAEPVESVEGTAPVDGTTES